MRYQEPLYGNAIQMSFSSPEYFLFIVSLDFSCTFNVVEPSI